MSAPIGPKVLGQKKNTKVKWKTRMFKNRAQRERFAKRNMDDVLDHFFESKTYRSSLTNP